MSLILDALKRSQRGAAERLPASKTKDEQRLEELRQVVEEATRSNREAMAALERTERGESVERGIRDPDDEARENELARSRVFEGYGAGQGETHAEEQPQPAGYGHEIPQIPHLEDLEITPKLRGLMKKARKLETDIAKRREKNEKMRRESRELYEIGDGFLRYWGSAPKRILNYYKEQWNEGKIVSLNRKLRSKKERIEREKRKETRKFNKNQ